MQRRIGVLLLCLLFGTAALADEVRRVELRVLDGDAPQANVMVRVKYADSERTNGVTLELVTSADGVASFEIPRDVFWLTVPELNRDVVGKEYRLANKLTRLVIRPRDWKPEIGVSQ